MSKMLWTVVALAAVGVSLSAPIQAQVSMPEAQVNALEGLAGKQAMFRRAQAKGVCASGYFVGNTVARNLSSATVFSGEKVPVVARFSVGGTSPKANDKARSVRGLALQLTPSTGDIWMTANISAPVYFVSKPEHFVPFIQARSPDPATGKPDAAKLKAFSDANPDTLRQGAYLAKAPIPASYGQVGYWGVNAFELVNAKKESQFVRWQFVPDAGTLGLTEEQLKTMPDDFLADELRKRVALAPVSFAFKLQLAEANDQLVDPTLQWPDSRPVLTAGTLVIDKVEPGLDGACKNLTFNPLALPNGIMASADPVLLARPAPYGISLGRRLSEAVAK
ncbi:Catalase-related peroxidase [Polaromonas vacuolata]|uniref:Catalase-related peroxidase n=1 Tax=Polaromonas vacuolata TaxID=37448 RepID=A0A6H2HDM8_9BURK|nr:catalase family peroxidase [Polaromonas vacuolata]QJC57684.1 Catalase-related peroxidase [Polaromonas vacuolata]